MKTLLFIFLFILNIITLQSQNLVFLKQTDLDSDNKIDKISLTQNDDGTLTLTVNSINSNIEFEYDFDEVNGFRIIDIDIKDNFKEIEVVASGPSGETFIKLYWFDGKNIRLMNTFKASLNINGNGIVYADSFDNFWTRRKKLILNKTTHKLLEIPQFAYYVGIKNIKVINYVSIYADEKLSIKTAILSKNSTIEILLCKKHPSDDHRDIYLIKSKSGLTGWIKYSELEKNCTGFNFAG